MSLHLGTDGWRGVIAEDCTFEEIRRVAAATARWIRNTAPDRPRAAVGFDPRFLSPEFAAAAADELARAGVGTLLSDRVIPTPAVSYHVRRLGLAAGIVITASHNPPLYNGFKIKAAFGGSAPPEVYEAVAAEIGRPVPPAEPAPVETVDLYGPYRERLASLVDLDAIRRAGLAAVADAMHGAAGSLVSEVAGGGKTRIVTLHAARDPLFGGLHPEPIGRNLSIAANCVRSEGLGLAVANDGDADRLGVLDRRGEFVSPHRVLALLLLHVFRRRKVSGGIAKTFSTSLLIDRVAAALGANLFETPIGFKHIAERMTRGEVAAGGEESGGYAFGFHLPERDGVLAALLLLESLALGGTDLDSALESLDREFGSFAYGRRDVYLPVPVIREFLEAVRRSPPERVAGERITEIKDLDGVKYVLGGSGWLLHRLSGTEPMVRLYCEHERPETVEVVLDEAARRLEVFARGRGASAREAS